MQSKVVRRVLAKIRDSTWLAAVSVCACTTVYQDSYVYQTAKRFEVKHENSYLLPFPAAVDAPGDWVLARHDKHWSWGMGVYRNSFYIELYQPSVGRRYEFPSESARVFYGDGDDSFVALPEGISGSVTVDQFEAHRLVLSIDLAVQGSRMEWNAEQVFVPVKQEARKIKTRQEYEEEP